MNRLFVIAGVLAAAVIYSCQTERHTGISTPDSGQSNVLFIIADDLRADALGYTPNQVIKTPSIDELRDNGTRFTNCYTMGGHQVDICAPGRAMLLSGRSLFHVYDNLHNVQTLPGYFALHGYQTFGTGKWNNSAESFEASFHKGNNVLLETMSDHFNVPCRDLGENGKLTEPMNKGFSTDLFAEAAAEFIESYAKGNQEYPFFCYLSFTAPHDPRSPREDYIGMYSDDEMPLPPNFMELHPFEFDDLGIRDETLAPWPRKPEHIKKSIADYYAQISHIDKRIGDLVDQLKKLNLYNNTVIIFTSDNGLALGSHGLLGKQNLYEHSTRVPLIIAGPGIPKGEERQALVYLFDLYPTLAALCGLPEPEEIDGKDLTPILTRKAEEVRSSVYTAYRNTVRSARTENWKLIWYLRRKHVQLFNLDTDPHELRNLAGIPENAEQLKRMTRLVIELHEANEDTATLYPVEVLPLEYDFTRLKQIPGPHQPEYVLKRFFSE